MDEAPYDKWLEFFQKKLDIYCEDSKKVLDLACGTGELTLALKKAGYSVAGVDLSEDMLAVAHEKAHEHGYQIPFYHQDMTNLEGLDEFDAVVIFCDSLNYLTNEEQVKQTFSSVYKVLKKGGLLLFDVHSLYKISNVYGDNTFAYNGDEISYIWSCFPGEEKDSVEHELSFFVLNEQEANYNRYDEWHQQRTYPRDSYKEWLEQAGFQVLSIEADFQEGPITEKAERIFFTAKK